MGDKTVSHANTNDALALAAAAYRDAEAVCNEAYEGRIAQAAAERAKAPGEINIERLRKLDACAIQAGVILSRIRERTPADSQRARDEMEQRAYDRGVRDSISNIPASFAALVVEAMAEAEKAMTKFPQPNYVISKFAEEAGEVVKAAIHHAEGRETRDAVVGEMRQALAMMLRLWIEGDQVHGMQQLMQDAGGSGK